MYHVHTQIGRYEFVHTAASLSDAYTVQAYLRAVGGPAPYITDANGERV